MLIPCPLPKASTKGKRMLGWAHKPMEEVIWSDKSCFHVHHVDRSALHGQIDLHSTESVSRSGCTSLLFLYRGKLLWFIPLENSDRVMCLWNISLQKAPQNN